VTERIWTAGDWLPYLSIAAYAGDAESERILLSHGIYADHCFRYDVHAWPCVIAAEVLNKLHSEEDVCSCGWSPKDHSPQDHRPYRGAAAWPPVDPGGDA
jgi:hypothetical protein